MNKRSWEPHICIGSLGPVVVAEVGESILGVQATDLCRLELTEARAN